MSPCIGTNMWSQGPGYLEAVWGLDKISPNKAATRFFFNRLRKPWHFGIWIRSCGQNSTPVSIVLTLPKCRPPRRKRSGRIFLLFRPVRNSWTSLFREPSVVCQLRFVRASRFLVSAASTPAKSSSLKRHVRPLLRISLEILADNMQFPRRLVRFSRLSPASTKSIPSTKTFSTPSTTPTTSALRSVNSRRPSISSRPSVVTMSALSSMRSHSSSASS